MQGPGNTALTIAAADLSFGGSRLQPNRPGALGPEVTASGLPYAMQNACQMHVLFAVVGWLGSTFLGHGIDFLNDAHADKLGRPMRSEPDIDQNLAILDCF